MGEEGGGRETDRVEAGDAGVEDRQRRFRLPGATHIGRVRIAVSNAARSAEFYRDVVGLRVLNEGRGDSTFVQMGAAGSDAVLLEIEELPGVRPLDGRRVLGLYHFAILLPSRMDLSAFIRHLRRTGVDAGSADHLYSEALYLVDPDGLTVEVYADRPREQWVYENGELMTGVEPLRLAELLALEPRRAWSEAPVGTTVGHVHFFIGDLRKAADFYSGGLGMDKKTWSLPGALFVSAGGYHHHAGLNTWAAGSPVATRNDPRLLFWELMVPSGVDRDAALASLAAQGFPVTAGAGESSVSDPWGNVVSLVAEGGA